MQEIFSPHPSLNCKHRQDCQRHQAYALIADGGPSEDGQHDVRDQSCNQTVHFDHWCTGEDSNLRTSLGGTDLQSVGFNHSPTCAKRFRVHSGNATASRGAQCSGWEPDARENPLARYTSSGNASVWSADGKLKPRRAINPPNPRRTWSWRRDLNP